MELLIEGFLNVLNIKVLLILFMAGAIGIILGALPGLTATMGVALLLPVTFGMEPVTGILLLVGVYFGAIYGGSITAILLRTPGTPSSAATALDGYEMTKKGLAYKALTVSTLSSTIGGVLSVIVLILIAPQLAEFALKFSAPESFALAFFGLAIISSISGKSLLKGLIAGVTGLLIATIGIDPIGGFPRFTLGIENLMSGVNYIPVLIGLFAASEAFRSVEDIYKSSNSVKAIEKVKLKWSEFKSLITVILRSSGIGTFIGMIPGAGGDIASFVAYNEAKRFSKKPEEFGKGNAEGVSASEAANNACTGGAMIPLLTLGIPGDAVTAVMLGALMVQGLQPGPLLFTNHGGIVYTLFIGMLLANLLILFYGLLGIRLFTKILTIPKVILTPIILILCIVGSYALGNNFFDVWVMLIAGIVGYFMHKYEFPVSPVILALILGPMLEANLRRSLVLSNGDISILFTRPISLILILLAVMTLFYPYITKLIKSRKNYDIEA
ncbi:tripartite tricarboxylate transporter permease [Bacillus sp. ISL-47]|uniref:tripartite tricarboxylate transporter permease n=1 Tax=Bacillus sp. ISL-47 TaxID=2819130 RepID=UPI001BE68F27|nr:tripartite tricarboxylate transporter permease [Bacillus sp. ISL-47]MBT2689846.1 tripartite tricarboxylate transporter permease [Bacillus sp. ISL-47]MBT2710223.1 tripartite tricarboxylate transporter permease [Pseudomonas sp. ISL-84]